MPDLPRTCSDNNIAFQTSLGSSVNLRTRHSFGNIDTTRRNSVYLADNARAGQPHGSTANLTQANLLRLEARRASASYSPPYMPAAAAANPRNQQHGRMPNQVAAAYTEAKPYSRSPDRGQNLSTSAPKMMEARRPTPGPRPVSMQFATVPPRIVPPEMLLPLPDSNGLKREPGTSQSKLFHRRRTSSSTYNQLQEKPVTRNLHSDARNDARNSQSFNLAPPRRQSTGYAPPSFRPNSWSPLITDTPFTMKPTYSANMTGEQALLTPHLVPKERPSREALGPRHRRSWSRSNRPQQHSTIAVTVRPKPDRSSLKADKAKFNKARASLPAMSTTAQQPIPTPARAASVKSSKSDDGAAAEKEVVPETLAELPAPLPPPPRRDLSDTAKRNRLSFVGRVGSIVGDFGVRGPAPAPVNPLGENPVVLELPAQDPIAPVVPRRRLSRPLSAVFLSSNTPADPGAEKTNFLQSKFQWRRSAPPPEADRAQQQQEAAAKEVSQISKQLDNPIGDEKEPLGEPNSALVVAVPPASKPTVAQRLGRSMHQRARSIVGTFKPRLARSKQPSNSSLSTDSSLESMSLASLDLAILQPRPPCKPTGPTLTVAFSTEIEYHDTWPSEEYDRTSGLITCSQLTPLLVEQIKEEVNSFKLEMEVHKLSKLNTHFYPE